MANWKHGTALKVPVNATDHQIGPPRASLIVVEYGDFECPHCVQAYPAIKILLDRFHDRMRFVFRHFPQRESHPHAEMAAEATEAAGAQGKFWPMLDRIFSDPMHLKDKALRAHAEALELDLRRYDAEMADHIYLQRVQEHRLGADASGVRGTPAFFVNGDLVDASFGIQRLGEVLEAELARSRHGR